MKRVLQPKEKYYSLMRNCILKPFSKYIEIPVWCKEETKKWHRNLFEQIQEDIKKALIDKQFTEWIKKNYQRVLK